MNPLWRYKEYVAVPILAVCAAVVWAAALSAQPSGKLKVAFMDVGQGDSIYIESPTGVEVVVDSGPDNSVLRDLPTVMPLFDRSLDAAIETHPDADHIAGFVELLKRYSVGDFIEPGITKDTLTAQTLEKEIAKKKIPRVIARQGMWIDLGGGARLDVLFPDYDVSHINQAADNDGGIVMRLVYGKTSVLLMADVSNVVENHLLRVASSTQLASTILKVGHHGSKTSSEDAFVTKVAPQIALISDGRNNKYGFPKKETLDILQKHNIQILRTDQDGTVEFESDGNTFTRVK